ncbi:MAG: immunoglobulin-like domain-containing protein, partial [Bacteroidia bacterium]
RTVFVVLNQTGPTLTLNGPSIQYVEVYNKYNELGWVAKDNFNNDISNQVIVLGTVDTASLGSYTLRYTVTDAFNITVTVTRLVNVGDTTRPVIIPKYSAGKNYYEHQIGRSFDYLDAVTITDNYWPLSNLDVEVFGTVNPNAPGLYILRYRARDPRGNIANELFVNIRVVDKVAPSIILNGLPAMNIEVFSTFNDPGVTVTDNYWPLNTILVTTKGNVNINKLGTYVRWYIAVDPSGNSDSVSRTINVVKTSIPVIRLLGSDPYNLLRFCPFNEPGVALEDIYYTEDELRPGLLIDNSALVNHLPGLYAIKYNLIDPSGNRAEQVIRRVNVLNQPCVVSVNDIKTNGLINVYPIPSNGYININSNDYAIKNVKVFDMLGSEIYCEKVANAKDVSFNIDKVYSGVYLLIIETDKGTLTEKINIVK